VVVQRSSSMPRTDLARSNSPAHIPAHDCTTTQMVVMSDDPAPGTSRELPFQSSVRPHMDLMGILGHMAAAHTRLATVDTRGFQCRLHTQTVAGSHSSLKGCIVHKGRELGDWNMDYKQAWAGIQTWCRNSSTCPEYNC